VTSSRARTVVAAAGLASVVVALLLATAGLAPAVPAASATGGAVAPPVRAPLLRLGSFADSVRAVQRRLRTRFRDGLYDALTRRAVARFQRARRLPATGTVDYRTARALRIDLAAHAAAADERPRVRVPDELERIARCESGGNPRAIGGGGRFRGKYQFTRDTWRRLGGWGDPAKAPEFVQDVIALRLWRAEGTKPWPACSRGL